jgi:VWA domain-containing protein/aerotolerance regulator-like protein
MNFLNPLILFAGLATIAPILLHLVRKEEARKVPFSSLMFITRMPKKSWRKQRLRHLLLLLLRVAALILLVLAFARPFFTWKASPNVRTAQAKALVILLDNSFSMQFGDRFEKAKNLALQLVGGLRGGDSVQIVAFSDTSEVLNSPQADHRSLQMLIRGLRPSYRSTNYAQALKLANQLLSSAANEVREIHWISDFQQTGWNDAQQDFSLDQQTGIEPHDVASSELGNTWLSQVQVSHIRNQENSLLKIRARAAASGLRKPASAALKLEINGKVVQERQLSLGTDGSEEIEFEPFTQPPGVVTGRVLLAYTDPLALDNTFHFVLSQRKAQRLLLLGESRGHNNLYLSKALAGSPDSPFAVDVHDIGTSAPFELGGYSAVLLNNVPTIPPRWTSSLYEFLKNGGGIIFAAGEHVSPTLLTGPIEKILPAHLTTVYKAESGKKELTMGEIQKQHPIFNIFGAVHYSYFLGTPFSGYVQCIPHEASHVLVRFEDGSPLLVEAAVGKGRSLLFTSSLNMDWNDLPLKSVFLPFCQQLAKYSVNFEEIPKAFSVGEVILLSKLNPLLDKLLKEIPGDAVSFSQSWKVEKPSGEKTEWSDRDLLQTPSFTLEEPGFYQTTVRNFRNWIAVNVDPRESDLRKIEPQRILSGIRKDTRQTQSSRQPLQVTADQRITLEARQRLWWFLTLLALAILLIESFLANRYYKDVLE